MSDSNWEIILTQTIYQRNTGPVVSLRSFFSSPTTLCPPQQIHTPPVINFAIYHFFTRWKTKTMYDQNTCYENNFPESQRRFDYNWPDVHFSSWSEDRRDRNDWVSLCKPPTSDVLRIISGSIGNPFCLWLISQPSVSSFFECHFEKPLLLRTLVDLPRIMDTTYNWISLCFTLTHFYFDRQICQQSRTWKVLFL